MTETAGLHRLAGRRGSAQPDLVVFDATKYLPNETQRRGRRIPRRPYSRARGSSTSTPSPMPTPTCRTWCPTPGRFARLIGALGVSQRQLRGVLRPEGPVLGGARLVDDGAVRPRPGGGAGWRAAEMGGRRTRRSRPATRRRPTPATFRPDFRAARLRGIGDMLANRRQPAANWCSTPAPPAGSPARCPEPRAGMRSRPYSGRAPTCPTPNCSPPTRPCCRRRCCAPGWPQAGVDGSRPVVTSCGSGVTRLHPDARHGARRPAAGRRL